MDNLKDKMGRNESTLADFISEDLLAENTLLKYGMDEKLNNILKNNDDDSKLIENIKNIFGDYIENSKGEFLSTTTHYKNVLLKTILDMNGCVDSEFLLHKYRDINSTLENDNDVVDVIDIFKNENPHLFKKNSISGTTPDSSSFKEAINKGDFKKMKYSEKLKLFTTNKGLYESLI